MTRRRRGWLGRPLMAVGLVLLAAGPALGHGSGARIEVAPDTVTAGGTVTLVGENLEPNDKRILILTGADLRLDLGTVTTDDQGMFSLQVTIPAHLPGAVYEFQAIGDETLTVQLNVVGGAGSSPGSQPTASEPAPRQRSPFELALLLVFTAISLGIGVLLVVRAERLGGHATPGV
jgi:hypothetical protein